LKRPGSINPSNSRDQTDDSVDSTVSRQAEILANVPVYNLDQDFKEEENLPNPFRIVNINDLVNDDHLSVSSSQVKTEDNTRLILKSNFNLWLILYSLLTLLTIHRQTRFLQFEMNQQKEDIVLLFTIPSIQ
jgi:hypothetical protein